MSTILSKTVTILQVIDTKPYADDDICERFRVDLLIVDSEGNEALIEIQNNNEYAYYQRTIFGLSKRRNLEEFMRVICWNCLLFRNKRLRWMR